MPRNNAGATRHGEGLTQFHPEHNRFAVWLQPDVWHLVRFRHVVYARQDAAGDRYTWKFRRVQAFREYALWHPASNRLIARARAPWAYVQRHTGQLMRVPDDKVVNVRKRRPT